MKKTLLLLTLCVGTILGASAQCTPVTSHFNDSTFVYPASLDTAVVGVAYPGAQFISIEIPDSIKLSQIVSGIPGNYEAYIDSVRFDSITGYPAGITSVSNPALGTKWLKPGEFACAIFSGTTTAAPGSYPLTISGHGAGHFFLNSTRYDSIFPSFPFSRVYPYKLNVKAAPNGISEVAAGVDLNIFPNPNQGNFTVTISSATTLNGTLTVVDQLGRTITTQGIEVAGTKQIPLELGNIAPGAYLLVINAAGSRSVKQFIVK